MEFMRGSGCQHADMESAEGLLYVCALFDSSLRVVSVPPHDTYTVNTSITHIPSGAGVRAGVPVRLCYSCFGGGNRGFIQGALAVARWYVYVTEDCCVCRMPPRLRSWVTHSGSIFFTAHRSDTLREQVTVLK